MLRGSSSARLQPGFFLEQLQRVHDFNVESHESFVILRIVLGVFSGLRVICWAIVLLVVLVSWIGGKLQGLDR